MTVLDASAVVAFLVDEPGGAEVLRILHRPVATYISSVNLAEVIDVLGRRTLDVEHVEREVELLLHGGLEVVAADGTVGRDAGRLRATHYHRRHRNVALGDCFAIATTTRVGGPLVTSDRALAEAAGSEGVEVVLIEDSEGRT